jgi:Transposase
MKRSRFSEEQVIAILREQEAGSSTADVCRKHGVSSATFYNRSSLPLSPIESCRGLIALLRPSVAMHFGFCELDILRTPMRSRHS